MGSPLSPYGAFSRGPVTFYASSLLHQVLKAKARVFLTQASPSPRVVPFAAVPEGQGEGLPYLFF